ATAGIEVDGVGMRRLLAGPVDARAFVLDDGSGRAQAPVRFDRERGHTAARVIGRQDITARGIDDEMTRRSAVGSLLVQERQISRVALDGEGADSSGGGSLKIAD